MKRIILSLLLVVSGALVLPAQKSIKSVVSSVDPVSDSIFFAAMRHRMDSVRAAMRRPTVALVLSGGGAKGAAHVGVIKRLEELQIPIDMVLGTSMGGLVGGIYALGYSPEFMDSLLTNADWSMLLSDKVPEDYIPYQTKVRRSRYNLTIPFNLVSGEIRERLRKNAEEAGDKVNEGSTPSSLMQSLPAGYAGGINVENLLSSFTVGYRDSISFMDLPIPYVCVSADIVSGKAKNWTGGDIATAMRSTMSIPGLFLPVRTNGMVLVDGGIRNNFPVDIAREMGADIVIGVTLTKGAADYVHVNNLGDMFGSVIDMLSREAYNKNIADADVHITPDLSGYGMLSFNAEAISSLLERGYKSALDKEEELERVAGLTAGRYSERKASRAVDIGTHPVFVKDVYFTGMDRKDSLYLSYKGKIRENVYYNGADVQDAVYRMFALGAFKKVGYKMHALGEDKYNLEMDFEPGPGNALGVAFRADNEGLVSLMLGVGYNLFGLRGHRVEFESKLGQTMSAMLRYSYIPPYLPSISVELLADRCSRHYFSALWNGNHYQDHEKSTAGVVHTAVNSYFASHRMQNMNIMAGARYDWYRLHSWMTDSEYGGIPKEIMPEYASEHFSLYADVRMYNMDDKYFPTKGHNGGIRYEFTRGKVYSGTNANIISANWQQHIGITKWLSLIPTVDARMYIMDKNRESYGPSLFLCQMIGGTMRGRYAPQQIPFYGFHNAWQMSDPYIACGSLDARVRIVPNVYASLQGSALIGVLDFSTLESDMITTIYGGAVQLAYKSLAGPIKARLEYSNVANFGFYIGMGLDF